jgi:hypothetical protein
LLRIEFAVRESCCAGPEPDTWELQKLLLQRTNSPNIILLHFHIDNFETSKILSWRHLHALLLLLFCVMQLRNWDAAARIGLEALSGSRGPRVVESFSWISPTTDKLKSTDKN